MTLILYSHRFISPVEVVEQKPDPEKLKAWVKSQSPSYQVAAEKIAYLVQKHYISYTTFLNELRRTVDSVKAKVGTQPVALFTYNL